VTKSEPFVARLPDAELIGERRGARGPAVVMLHEGVADRRSWRVVAEALADQAVVMTYDRRGHGETARSDAKFSHVEDLLGVIDEMAVERLWLAGTSAGGGVALDATLLRPDRIAGLVLLAPGVSGAPEPELDPDTERIAELIEAAMASGDLDEVNRYETWLWLDGPAQPEGRVGGPARALALEMNATILRQGVDEEAGASGVDAWNRLDEVQVPTIVACGELDVPFLVRRSQVLAERIPGATYRSLGDVAHLSELEQPSSVASLLGEALSGGAC
jgi:pimeloyl-ACP methyl ester carboxylesterase